MLQETRHSDDTDVDSAPSNETTHALQLALFAFMRRAAGWASFSVTPASLSAALHDLSNSTHSHPHCIALSPDLYGGAVVQNSAPCLIRCRKAATALPRDDSGGPIGTAVFTCPVHIDAREPVGFCGVWFASHVVVSGPAHVFFHQCLFGAAPGMGVRDESPLPQQPRPHFANVDVGASGTRTFSECEFDYICGNVNSAGLGEVPALTARDWASLEIYNSGFAGAYMPATVIAVRDAASFVAEHVTIDQCPAHCLVVSDRARATVRHSVFGRSGSGVWVCGTGALRLRATTLEPAQCGRGGLTLTQRAACDAGGCEFIGALDTSVASVPLLSLAAGGEGRIGRERGRGITGAAAASSLSFLPFTRSIIVARDRSRLALTDCDVYWESAVTADKDNKHNNNNNNYNNNNESENMDHNEEAVAGRPPRTRSHSCHAAVSANPRFCHIFLCERSEATVTRCRLRLPHARVSAASILFCQAPRIKGIPLYAAENTIVFDSPAINDKSNGNADAWGLVLPSEPEADTREDSENVINKKAVGGQARGAGNDDDREKEEEEEEEEEGKEARGKLRQIAAMWSEGNHFIRSDATPILDPVRMYTLCDMHCVRIGQSPPLLIESGAAHKSQLLGPTSLLCQGDSFDHSSNVSTASHDYTHERSATVIIDDDDRTRLTTFGEAESGQEGERSAPPPQFEKCHREPKVVSTATTRSEQSLGESLAGTVPPPLSLGTTTDTKQQQQHQQQQQQQQQPQGRSETKRLMPSPEPSPVITSHSTRDSQWVDRRMFLAAAQGTQSEGTRNQIHLDRKPSFRRGSTIEGARGAIARTERRQKTPLSRYNSFNGREKATERKATAPANLPRAQSMNRAVGNATNAVKERRNSRPVAKDLTNVRHRTCNQKQEQPEPIAPCDPPTPQKSDRNFTSNRDASRTNIHTPMRRSSSSSRRRKKSFSIGPNRNSRNINEDEATSPTREVWPWEVEALRRMLRKKLGLYPNFEAYERAFQSGGESDEGGGKGNDKEGFTAQPNRANIAPFLRNLWKQAPPISCAPGSRAQESSAVLASSLSSASVSRRRRSLSVHSYDDHIVHRGAPEIFGELVTALQRGQQHHERFSREEMENHVYRIYTEASRRGNGNGTHKELPRRPLLSEQCGNVCGNECGTRSRPRPSLQPPSAGTLWRK